MVMPWEGVNSFFSLGEPSSFSSCAFGSLPKERGGQLSARQNMRARMH